MIYLVPDWELGNTDFDRDEMIYMSKLFDQYGIENQVILINSQPFIQHYAQFFDVRYDRLVVTFDILQDIQSKEGHPIGIQDLNFPNYVEKLYTSNELLLIKDNTIYGKVFSNSFGFVDSTIYYLENGWFIEIYDERGFISKKEYYEGEVLIKREYFNETAALTLSEYLTGETKVVIEKGHRKLSVGQEYRNLNSLLSEIFIDLFRNMDMTRDKVLMTVSPVVLEIVDPIPEKNKFIYHIASTDNLESLQRLGWLGKILAKPNLLTEARPKRDQIWSMQKRLYIGKSQMSIVPMHHAKVDLGESNTIRELIIYWRIGLWEKSSVQTMDTLLKKILDNKDVRLIIETELRTRMEDYERLLIHFINTHFLIQINELELKKKIGENNYVSHYIKKDLPEDAVIQRNYKNAGEFLECISVLVAPMSIVVREIFRKVRLFVELRDVPDYFFHSMAVSRGIPILAKETSDYFIDGKNGKLVRNHYELKSALDKYLDFLNPWNEALVAAIDIIENNNEEKLIDKWRKVLQIDSEGSAM